MRNCMEQNKKLSTQKKRKDREVRRKEKNKKESEGGDGLRDKFRSL
jgi:hypothetical protein